MRIRSASVAATLLASPAWAADKPFFSLSNTDFVVWLGLLVFIGVLFYFGVFRTLGGMLDKRSEGIRSDLAEARELREEAQTLLASYERRHQDVTAQADRIVAASREEAKASAEQAEADMARQVERRVEAAKEQIAQAESAALRAVRDRAIRVAIAAASDVLSRQTDGQRGDDLIERSIDTVGEKLH